MASTPFRVVNFSPNELIGPDKIDQMNSNMIWLRDNTPRAYYTLPSGVRRVEGLRIAGGRAIISARNADSAGVDINFNNLFSQGCEPIVTTGVTTMGSRNVFCVVNGLGQTVNPDNRGFSVFVRVFTRDSANSVISKTMYVNWQALGY